MRGSLVSNNVVAICINTAVLIICAFSDLSLASAVQQDHPLPIEQAIQVYLHKINGLVDDECGFLSWFLVSVLACTAAATLVALCLGDDEQDFWLGLIPSDQGQDEIMMAA